MLKSIAFFKDAKRIDIYTFAIIFLSSSFVITNDIFSSLFTTFLWVLLLITLVIKSKSFSPQKIVMPIITCFLFLFTSLFHDENIVSTFKALFTIVCAAFYVTSFDKDEIIDSIIRVVKWLALFSILLFVAYIFIKPLNRIFITTNRNGKVYSCLLFYVQMVGVKRNCGMFWEPGAFQAFLNIALLFEITKKNRNIWTILLLAATIMTTFSTTGYAALLLNMSLLLTSGKKISATKWRNVILVFSLVAVLVYFFQDTIFNTNQNTIFGKISTFLEYREYNGTRHTSASVRYFSLIKVFEVFLKNPLFGAGKSKTITETFYYLNGNLTCTFANWFAFFGIVFGGIMLFGYFSLCKYLQKSFFTCLISFLCMMMIIMSENFAENAFFYVIPFLGYIKDNPFILKEAAYGK